VNCQHTRLFTPELTSELVSSVQFMCHEQALTLTGGGADVGEGEEGNVRWQSSTSPIDRVTSSRGTCHDVITVLPPPPPPQPLLLLWTRRIYRTKLAGTKAIKYCEQLIALPALRR